MARRDERWSEWCLLPAFDWAIVFKKVGLVLAITCAGFVTDHSFVGWLGNFLQFVSILLYQFTYITVLYALWAPSGGTRTMFRAIASTVVLAFLVGLLATFNLGGYANELIEADNEHHNGTKTLWPSLTAGGVGDSGLTVYATPHAAIGGTVNNQATQSNFFWTAIGEAAVGVVLAVGVALGWWSRPRQPALFVALYVLFVMTAFANYFTQYESVTEAFGFSPLVLWGVIEVPVKVYIMLLDSRVSHTLQPDAPTAMPTCT